MNRTAGHRRAGDEFWHFRGAILELRTECARLPKFGGVHRGPLRIHEHHEPAENDRMNLDESIDSMAPIWDICFTNVQHSCISLASPTLVRYATVRGRLPPDAFCLGILVRCCRVTCLLCLFCGSILNFRGSMIVVIHEVQKC